MDLVGRESELDRARGLLAAPAGGARGLGLEGEPGVGKSALWRAAVAEARAAGYGVLLTTPTEPDAELSFAGLADLLEDLPSDALEVLPEPQRRALSAALLLEEPVVPSGGRGALGRAVLATLRRLAIRQPLLVAIDDEPWLDGPSADALAFALTRLRTEHTAVLMTTRPGGGGPVWQALQRTDRLEVVALAPLGRESVARLLTTRLDRPLPNALVSRVHELAGGNPLYALAIASELPPNARDADDVPVPTSLAGAITRRLARLDAAAAAPLLVVAACGAATHALLAAALPEFRLRDLDSPLAAGVVELGGDAVRFSHPLLASVHYARAEPQRRRELHRRLAEIVAEEEQRAEHLAAAAEAPDLQIAAVLERAATTAARRGAPARAAALFADAARLTPLHAVPDRHGRAVSATEQRYAAGDADGARAELNAIMPQLPAGATRARALKQSALLAGDLASAERILEQALSESASEPALAVRVRIELALTCHNRGLYSSLMGHAEAAVAQATATGDRELLALALGERALARFFTTGRVEIDELSGLTALEEDSLLSTYQLPTGVVGQLLLWSDRLEAARPWLERATQRALQRGEEYDRGAMLVLLALLEWEAGNLELADRYAAAAAEAWAPYGAEPAWWMAWFRSWSATGRGDYDGARAAAQEGVDVCRRLAAADAPIIAPLSIALAAAELAGGDAQAAHERLTEVRRRVRTGGLGVFASMTVGLWSVDVDALLALSRPEEAGRLAAEMLQLAAGSDNPAASAVAHRSRGLVLAHRGDTGAALAELHRAIDHHSLRPVALERDRTLRERQRLEHPGGGVVTGRGPLERPALPGATERLSRRERELLGLLAEGLTDAQIAQRLYISVRTVHSHLDRIRDKTGARRRAELTRLSLSLQP